MVGIVLAAGSGIRFSSVGCCKPLLRINQKYLIEYSLKTLISLKVKEIVIVVGKYTEKIQNAIGYCYDGIPVRYIVQQQPLGLMNALYCAAEALHGEKAVLQLSDEVFINIKSDEIEKHMDADFLCGYTVPENKQIIRENYAISCRNGVIEFTVEKPKQFINEKKGTGFCVFSAACFEILKENYTETISNGTLCDFINLLVRSGKKGAAVHVAEEEINVNDVAMFIYAKQRVERAGHE